MSDEIRALVNLQVNKSGYSDTVQATDSFDMTGLACQSGIYSIGTSEEDFSPGDVSSLGYCFIKNLDATNYITYGPKSGGGLIAFGRLNPGEFALMRLSPAITLRLQAHTGACLVDVRVYQD